MNQRKYWVVWPEGLWERGTFKKPNKYQSLDKAREIAQKLRDKTGGAFHVFELVETLEAT